MIFSNSSNLYACFCGWSHTCGSVAQSGALATYARSVAAQTSALSSIFGVEHTLNGLNIITHALTLVIVAECTAIFLMIAYTALILAYPFSIEIKVLALFAGLILIYLLNLARLVLTVALSDHVSQASLNRTINADVGANMRGLS